MYQYKNNENSVIQRIQYLCDDQQKDNDEKEIPDEFYQNLEQLLSQIVILQQSPDSYDELCASISELAKFIDDFKEYCTNIVDFIQSFEQDQLFEDKVFFEYLLSIYKIGESGELMISVLLLIDTITEFLSYQYWSPFISLLFDDLIQIISYPSKGLHYDLNLNNRTFNDSDEVCAREHIVNILFHFLLKMFNEYQINKEQYELFNECYEYCRSCIIQCTEAIEKVDNNIDQLLLLIDFLNFLLNVFCMKYEKQNSVNRFDEDDDYSFHTIIEFLKKYVINVENPEIKLAYLNLSKLIKIGKKLMPFDENFLIKIFECFTEDSNYRKENQQSLIIFLSSIPYTYNIRLIEQMMNVIQNFSFKNEEYDEPLMLAFAHVLSPEELIQYFNLCSALILSCFKKIDVINNQQNDLLNQKSELIKQQSNFPIPQINDPNHQSELVELPNLLQDQSITSLFQNIDFLIDQVGFVYNPNIEPKLNHIYSLIKEAKKYIQQIDPYIKPRKNINYKYIQQQPILDAPKIDYLIDKIDMLIIIIDSTFKKIEFTNDPSLLFKRKVDLSILKYDILIQKIDFLQKKIIQTKIPNLFYNEQIDVLIKQISVLIKEGELSNNPRLYSAEQIDLLIQRNNFLLQNIDSFNQISDKLKNQLFEIANNWICYMFDNGILFLLCNMALNDDLYNNKLSATCFLSQIVPYLSDEYILELIIDHQFIEIIYQFINNDKETYMLIVEVVKSILNLISLLPVDQDSADLYLRLAESDIFNEIEESEHNEGDENIMRLVESVLDQATKQNDRLSEFLPK